MNVDYKRAARIDDHLQIRSRYTGTQGVRVIFEQSAMRGEEIIAEALVTAVMIHADGRPRRPIPEVVEQLKPYIYQG